MRDSTLRKFSVLPAHAGVIPGSVKTNPFANRITRTCGGDPAKEENKIMSVTVLPAHAGVILEVSKVISTLKGITRTCGGDPDFRRFQHQYPRYYPHMRG